ncbi:MAG: dTMP kinase [Candidatus Yonathbacteria bacterium]|nr:dTMP kinase [Candidatus Yonathbacteria bacterium]
MESAIAVDAPLIVIDGLDGCGKTTQVKLLSDRLEREDRACVFTREPGGAPLSEALRELFMSDLGEHASALTQFLMMWASRRNYLEKVVWPALRQGLPVFSDRGDSSTLAYQVYAKNTPELEDEFWRMRKLVCGEHFRVIYIFLDVPPETAHVRAIHGAEREETSHLDSQSLEFYKKVRDGFLAFRNSGGAQVFNINGTRNAALVHEDVYHIVGSVCDW